MQSKIIKQMTSAGYENDKKMYPYGTATHAQSKVMEAFFPMVSTEYMGICRFSFHTGSTSVLNIPAAASSNTTARQIIKSTLQHLKLNTLIIICTQTPMVLLLYYLDFSGDMHILCKGGGIGLLHFSLFCLNLCY